jgi:hypothetical protein
LKIVDDDWLADENNLGKPIGYVAASTLTSTSAVLVCRRRTVSYRTIFRKLASTTPKSGQEDAYQITDFHERKYTNTRERRGNQGRAPYEGQGPPTGCHEKREDCETPDTDGTPGRDRNHYNDDSAVQQCHHPSPCMSANLRTVAIRGRSPTTVERPSEQTIIKRRKVIVMGFNQQRFRQKN